jgi:hypothetical protein
MTDIPRRFAWWAACSLLFACGSSPAAPQDDQPDSAVVLSWNRDGGFAGFCDELKVTAAGNVTASSCRTPGSRSRRLPSDELTRLNDWRKRFGSVSITSGDSGSADGMTLKLTLTGGGRDEPSAAQRQELLEWAQRIFSETNG